VNRKRLQKLAEIRLREAKLLFSASAPDGAYYLAGYAVECAMKSCIARSTNKHDFPDLKRVQRSYTHKLSELISVAGLDSEHREAMRELEFAYRWDIVAQWSEGSRYNEWSLQEAEALIEAIENRRHGALQWLRKYW